MTKVVQLDSSQNISLLGQCILEVISGAVEIFGCVLTPKHGPRRLVSSSHDPLLTITNPFMESVTLRLSNLFDGLEELQNENGSFVIGLDEDRLNSSFWINPPGEYFPMKVPDQWKQVADVLLSSPRTARPPCVLICGPRKVGKSTAARYFLNSLLNTWTCVAHLDLDPGQTEFMPPGFLTLRLCEFAMLEPSFAHATEADHAKFFGSNSVETSPLYYLYCIRDLISVYQSKYASIPLIVNTMGWVTGLGLSTLQVVVRLLNPTHTIVMSTNTEVSRITKSLTDDMPSDLLIDCPNLNPDQRHGNGHKMALFLLEDENIAKIQETQVGRFAAQKRDLITSCYFGRASVSSAGNVYHKLDELIVIPPIRINLDDIKIKLVPETLGQMNSPSIEVMMLASMALSVIGLSFHSSDGNKDDDCNNNNNNIDGAAIIRAVDPLHRTIDIITPIPIDRFIQDSGLTIYYSQTLKISNKILIRNALAVHQPSPYISAIFPHVGESTLLRTRKVRSNLKRRWE